MRNIVLDFTKDETNDLLSKCSFTSREKELFLLRQKELSLEECSEIMHYSVRTISGINKSMNRKIIKVVSI